MYKTKFYTNSVNIVNVFQKQIQWLLLWAGEMNRKPLIESRYEFTRWSNSVIGTKNATPFFIITYVHHDWNRLALTGKGYNRVLFPWISAISEHDYISCWTLAVNKKFWKSAWSSSLMKSSLPRLLLQLNSRLRFGVSWLVQTHFLVRRLSLFWSSHSVQLEKSRVHVQ